jgi:hypothetical protein
VFCVFLAAENLIDSESKTKAMAALLSGEMKDTVDLNPAGAYGLDTLSPCYFAWSSDEDP